MHDGCAYTGVTPKDRKDKQALQVATAAAESLGVPVQHVGKHDLNVITNQRPHQVRTDMLRSEQTCHRGLVRLGVRSYADSIGKRHM